VVILTKKSMKLCNNSIQGVFKMPRYSSQKLKPLYLARILLERTDENNVMSTTDLVKALAAYDIPVERKS
jgi:hypothetical protein